MRDGMREQWPSKVSISASPHSKIPWERGRSSGWAAFDLKQRGKHGLEPELEFDPYPPIPSTLTSRSPLKNFATNSSSPARPFSSVVKPSTEFPVLVDNSNYSKKQVIVGGSSRELNNKVELENNVISSLEKLKELHHWADVSLINDVLGTVNYDFDQASVLLSSMISSSSSEQSRTINPEGEKSLLNNSLSDNKVGHACEGFPSKSMTDLAGLRSALEHTVRDTKTEKKSEDISIKSDLCYGTTHEGLVSQYLTAAPVEPEWEEDDVYLIHRRDAIKTIRSAAQHSRAAGNAFLRGDHFSAQKFSLKAREEWLVAENLNAKAAREILSIRNKGNDTWKLDLHGLHASEAVHALHEHLWKIETQILMNRSVSPNRILKSQVEVSSLHSFNCLGLEAKPGKEQSLSSHRPTILQVITGTGNHSRGQASLPDAIRSFLLDNGYHFDEARPGVIAVRPKFRNQ